MGHDLTGIPDDIAFGALADGAAADRPTVEARTAGERIGPAYRLRGRRPGVMRIGGKGRLEAGQSKGRVRCGEKVLSRAEHMLFLQGHLPGKCCSRLVNDR